MKDQATAPGSVSGPAASPLITDAPERQRYEAHLDDVLGGVLEYVVRRDRIILAHTEVSPGFEGQGIAAALTRFAIDDARRVGRRVIAACQYVKQYVAKHGEDLDIVIRDVQA